METTRNRDLRLNSTLDPFDSFGNDVLWSNPQKLANDISNDLIGFIKDSLRESSVSGHTSQKTQQKKQADIKNNKGDK